MVSNQILQRLHLVAERQVGIALARRGETPDSELRPYLQATVKYEPNSELEVVSNYGHTETHDIYRFIPRAGENANPPAFDTESATQGLYELWVRELGNLERHHSQREYEEAVQRINREYFKASEERAEALAELGIRALPAQPYAAPSISTGSGSAVGTVGCVLASAAAIIVAIALVCGLMSSAVGGILRGNGGNTEISSNVTTGGGTSTDVSTCLQQSGFDGSSGPPSAGTDFQDIDFPAATVSYFGNSFNDGSYQFQMIEVCTVTASPDDVRAFYASSMPNNGWTQTSTFPYAGNPSRACGDPYCWTKGSSPTRFASLESVKHAGDDVLYELRLGELP